MRYSLAYGTAAAVDFDLPEATVTDCTAPRGQPLADVVGAVMATLRQPLDYPPLAAATVPGDRVALAVEPGLPQVEAVVAGAVFTLAESGASPRDIAVVVASNLRPPLALLPKALRQDLRVVLHNPSDRDGLQYLAADKAARPIYLNRALCDADLALPISMPRLRASLDDIGGYSGLFPAFADVETQQRFRAPSSADHAAHQRKRKQEADDAAWLLGIHFALQVVPGRGDEVLHVLAGQAKDVVAAARRAHEEAWLHAAPHKASLVVAAIDGGDDQQTWENFARGLYAAMQAAADGGALVLLTSLSAAPGPALQRLMGGLDDDELSRELAQTSSPDAQAASLLVAARERFDVYLLSGLEREVVEEFGIGHVASIAEITRLARRQKSVTLLGGAQHAACEVSVLV